MTRAIKLRTEIPGPASRALAARRAAALPRGVGSTAPIWVASAAGATVTDVDGNVFIDFAGGIGTLNVGHANAEVVARGARPSSTASPTPASRSRRTRATWRWPRS